MAELNSNQNYLIIVVGPTAVGKTSTAINLAKHFSSPIISFDSRQFYKEMSIGTAKPNEQELNEVKHYFIDSISIHDSYTSGKFENEALNLLDKLFNQHKIIIAVGGSGLYIDALYYGIDEIPTNEKIREQLIERWHKEGLEKLQQDVLLSDPEYFHEADMQNPRRVIRALEVFLESGKPYSFFRKNKPKDRNFTPIWIGLNLEREILFERINNRVDQMFDQGLLKEVQDLYEYKDLKALKTVGYQELFEFLNNKISLDQAKHLIKRNTRVFAKKQLAWFNRNPDIQWFSPNDFDKILKTCQIKISK